LEALFTVLATASRITGFVEALVVSRDFGGRSKLILPDCSGFSSNAVRFYYEIQFTTRAVAGSLQSTNRDSSLRRSRLNSGNRSMLSSHGRLVFAEIAPMTAALSRRGFQQRRTRRAASAPLIQGISVLAATLRPSGAVWNSIRPPAKVRPLTNRVAFHFIEIEVSGIAAFESLLPTKSKRLH
jgi:hypothetical protein